MPLFATVCTPLITNIDVLLELKGEDGWTKLNHAENFDTSLGTVRDNVPRQDCNKISKSEFVERFEKPRIPVVLTHTMDHWKSMRKWSVEVCGKDTQYMYFMKV